MGTPGKPCQPLSVGQYVRQIRCVYDLLARGGDQQGLRQGSNGRFAAVWQGEGSSAFPGREAALERGQPRTRCEAQRRQSVLAHVDLHVWLESEGEHWRPMIQHRRAHPKFCIAQQHAIIYRLLAKRLHPAMACLDPKSNQPISMYLRHLKARSSITDAIPTDAPYHALDVVCETRRAKQAAGDEVTQSQAHEPHEAADVIRMGMADENVAHLVHHACRQASRLAEVEQQAAASVAKPQMQQRIPEHAVHQGRCHRPDLQQWAGPLGAIRRCDISRGYPMKRLSAKRRGSDQEAALVTLSVAHDKPVHLTRKPRRAHG
jgi:hypothetical protein